MVAFNFGSTRHDAMETADKTSQQIASLVQANRQHCMTLLAFLERLDAVIYTMQEDDVASLGGHVRHIIEFMQCFLDHSVEGVVRYDARPRNQELEENIDEAKKTLQMLIDRFGIASIIGLPERIKVQESVLEREEGPEVYSSVERELMFLCSHTVHHMGIMKLIAKNLGINTPADFGKAPSTIQFERGTNS